MTDDFIQCVMINMSFLTKAKPSKLWQYITNQEINKILDYDLQEP